MSAGQNIILRDIEIQKTLWISKACPSFNDWHGAAQMFFCSRPFVEFQIIDKVFKEWAAGSRTVSSQVTKVTGWIQMRWAPGRKHPRRLGSLAGRDRARQRGCGEEPTGCLV